MSIKIMDQPFARATGPDPPPQGDAMKLLISGLLAIAAFALADVLGSVQSLAQNAYITNYGDNTVSVINTATNTVIAVVTVGLEPFGVAVTPNGREVYVTNSGSNDVSVINAATNTVVATIPVDLKPEGVAVTPDGSKAYVANLNGNGVSVIDTASPGALSETPAGRLEGSAAEPAASAGLRLPLRPTCRPLDATHPATHDKDTGHRVDEVARECGNEQGC